MTKPYETWTVLPHGALVPIDDTVLTITGTVKMPIGDIERRMTVVQLADRRLVIYSAIALDAAAMEQLEAFGTPAFLVVPGDHHRLDAHAWKVRFPTLTVVAPAGAEDKVAESVVVDTTAPDFGDPKVRFLSVSGTRDHEAALMVDGARGATLVLNDLIGNIRGEHGFSGWLLRRMGLAGDHAQIPVATKMMLVDDKAALKAQLLMWAAIPSLRCILVSHGEPITDNPQQVLRDLAATLD